MRNFHISWSDVSGSVFSTSMSLAKISDSIDDLVNMEGIVSILVLDENQKTIFATNMYESNSDVPTLINENTTDFFNLLNR